MGSGAFLVAACRYLAARLLEAWSALDDGVEWTAFGRPRADAPDEPAVPAEQQERELLAHRLVAERCLYGVDKNPMAVEMAKLSLWLITLGKDRPFSFVDHALRAGDSLLGVTELRQLRVAHIDPGWHRQGSIEVGFDEISRGVDRALELRRELEAFAVRDVRDADRKADLLARAEEALADARLVGDLVVGAALSRQPDDDPLTPRVAAELRRLFADDASETDRAAGAHASCARSPPTGSPPARRSSDLRPLHWALEFPEVARGSTRSSATRRSRAARRSPARSGRATATSSCERIAGGVRGSADLVAYFFLRAGAAAAAAAAASG